MIISDLEIKDVSELLNEGHRFKLLDQYIHALEQGEIPFPATMFRVVEVGNIYGIKVKDDVSRLCLEWPIRVTLEPDPATPGRVIAHYSLVELAVNWLEVQQHHVIYQTVGPRILRPLYLRYLQGFRVSQLGASANAQKQS